VWEKKIGYKLPITLLLLKVLVFHCWPTHCCSRQDSRILFVVVVACAILDNLFPRNSPPVTTPFCSARQHLLTFQFNGRDVIVIATEGDSTQVPCILNTRACSTTPCQVQSETLLLRPLRPEYFTGVTAVCVARSSTFYSCCFWRLCTAPKFRAKEE
jgi:hypothetical protein